MKIGEKKGKKIIYKVQKHEIYVEYNVCEIYNGKRKFININLLTKINSQNLIKLIKNINKF